MKTFLSLRILKNDYILLFFILSACYVLSLTTFHFAGRVGYTLIVFLFFTPRINENTYIWYSLIFGFFYDFLVDGYFGISVIVFLLLSLARITCSELFNMSTYFSRMVFGLGAVVFFNIFNILYFGYEFPGAIDYMVRMSAVDFIVYFILLTVLELKRVFA